MNKYLLTLAVALAGALTTVGALASPLNTDDARAEAAAQTRAFNQAAALSPFVEPKLVDHSDPYYGSATVETARREHAAHLAAVLRAGSGVKPAAVAVADYESASRAAHEELVQQQLLNEYAVYAAGVSATKQAAN